MKDILVVIPARYGSTRFPGKVLAPLLGKPVLQWCYEAALRARLGPVLVATDDPRVSRIAAGFGAETVLTPRRLPSGTDRVHAAVRGRSARWILNLQGDEPMVDPGVLRRIAALLRRHPEAEMATAAVPIRDRRVLLDPNVVKVVTGPGGRALYFSRSPIPHSAPGNGLGTLHWQHLGIYGFQRRALDLFVRTPPSRLERQERLEQLRALEKGFTILVTPAREAGIGIDTPNDLRRAERLFRKRGTLHA